MYVLESAILANSITIQVGDAVIIDAAAPEFVTGNDTNVTLAVLGTVLNIKNGPAEGNTFLQKNSVTTSGTNQTVEKVSVDILLSNNLATLVADLDAPAGTTTNSQFFGYFAMDAGSNGVLDESSYSASTPKQFLSFGVVPGNQSQVFGIWSTVGRI